LYEFDQKELFTSVLFDRKSIILKFRLKIMCRRLVLRIDELYVYIFA